MAGASPTTLVRNISRRCRPWPVTDRPTIEQWSPRAETDAQHDRYRRSLRFLVVTIVLMALALVIHPAVAGMALALLPIIGIHVVLVRHSRSRVRIPDYRTGGVSDSNLPTA